MRVVPRLLASALLAATSLAAPAATGVSAHAYNCGQGTKVQIRLFDGPFLSNQLGSIYCKSNTISAQSWNIPAADDNKTSSFTLTTIGSLSRWCFQLFANDNYTGLIAQFDWDFNIAPDFHVEDIPVPDGNNAESMRMAGLGGATWC